VVSQEAMAMPPLINLIVMTATGGRPKPESCFSPGLLLKESYGNLLSGRGSNTNRPCERHSIT